MKPQNDDAYVLRTQPLGESDWIVSLLARQHGLVRGVARGARRSRKRFAGLLQPLNEVRARWVEKSGRDLHRLEAVEARTDWSGIQADPTIHGLCAVLSEVTEAFSHEAQAEEEVYRLLGATLEGARDGVSCWLLLRYFEYWMLRLHGLLDRIDLCARCGATADARAAVVEHSGLLCRDCHAADGKPGKPFGGELRSRLAQFAGTGPSGLTGDDRDARAGGTLEALLRGRLEAFAEKRFRTYRHFATLATVPEIDRR